MPIRLSHLSSETSELSGAMEQLGGPKVVPGGVVEWLMALVLKTSEVKASVGSNPTPSAFPTSLKDSLFLAAQREKTRILPPSPGRASEIRQSQDFSHGGQQRPRP